MSLTKPAVIGCVRIDSKDRAKWRLSAVRCIMCHRTSRPGTNTCCDLCQSRYAESERLRQIRRLEAQMGNDGLNELGARKIERMAPRNGEKP